MLYVRPGQPDILLDITEHENYKRLNEKAQSFLELLGGKYIGKKGVVFIWGKDKIFQAWFRGEALVLDEKVAVGFQISDNNLISNFLSSLSAGVARIISGMWRNNNRLHRLINDLSFEDAVAVFMQVLNSCKHYGVSGQPKFIFQYIRWVNKLDVLNAVLSKMRTSYSLQPYVRMLPQIQFLQERINRLSPNKAHAISTNIFATLQKLPSKRERSDEPDNIEPPTKFPRREPNEQFVESFILASPLSTLPEFTPPVSVSVPPTSEASLPIFFSNFENEPFGFDSGPFNTHWSPRLFDNLLSVDNDYDPLAQNNDVFESVFK